MRRPCDRLGRGAPTPDCASLCPLLQRSENAPIVGQRRAVLAPGSAHRSHHVACAPRRTASPLHARLSFRYTQPIKTLLVTPSTDERAPSMRSAIVVLTRWIASAFMTLHPWQCAPQANVGWLHWQLFRNEYAAAPVSWCPCGRRSRVGFRLHGFRLSVERGYGTSKGDCPDQSGLAPENWITFAHFSVSSAMSLR